jgi:hypothetical protein
LTREVALRGADVGEGLVVLPGKHARDGHVGAATHAGHRGQELLETCGIGVEHLEEARAATLELVLRKARPKPFGQTAPEGIQPAVRHLEESANIGRLLLVEEEVRLRSVGVLVFVAGQESEGDQRVEEVPRRSGMQTEPSAKDLEVLGPGAELGEHPHLHGAEERLGAPEGESRLEDSLRCQLLNRLFGHSDPPRGCFPWSAPIVRQGRYARRWNASTCW